MKGRITAGKNIASQQTLMKSPFLPKRYKGTTTVEFALVAGLFMLLMFAIIDIAMIGFVNLTMQNAVREGARYAVTGCAELDPRYGDPEEPEYKADRKEAVKFKIKEHSMGLYDRVMKEGGLTVKDPDDKEVSGVGNPGQLIVIQLNGSWPLMTPLLSPFFENGNFDFTVSAAMKNEFFKEGEYEGQCDAAEEEA
ncbi:hypothetical protein CBP31_14210 [Oceanisphaera profunda]|uniref:TadE-like domain-containing protein n=1 Tax=Oceanisphaera profunda TaxID=1416627 RepID=A0A1Y0D7V2_9GAMM|nr:TadE family protein [Oceanisphaera profunda]ART83641.1 hypothetical protein CBP31_14210 [Oceanisphaera profunda]